MALINRLIAEAKAGRTVVIRPHEVRKVAEHIRKLDWRPTPRTAEAHEALMAEHIASLKAGKVHMLGVPVVVRGN